MARRRSQAGGRLDLVPWWTWNLSRERDLDHHHHHHHTGRCVRHLLRLRHLAMSTRWPGSSGSLRAMPHPPAEAKTPAGRSDQSCLLVPGQSRQNALPCGQLSARTSRDKLVRSPPLARAGRRAAIQRRYRRRSDTSPPLRRASAAPRGSQAEAGRPEAATRPVIAGNLVRQEVRTTGGTRQVTLMLYCHAQDACAFRQQCGIARQPSQGGGSGV